MKLKNAIFQIFMVIYILTIGEVEMLSDKEKISAALDELEELNKLSDEINKDFMNIENTLNEREKRYGQFRNNASISQILKDVMCNTDNWHTLMPTQKEALDMIAHKIARILNGDPDYIDSWHDIAGFATLVVNDLTQRGR
jgi:hypothetical protein